MVTFATPANMRAFEARNPGRDFTDSDGNRYHVEGRRCFAVSVNDPEERCSASAGDYFMLADDQPLTDSAGEPMVLALERTCLVDAFDGEPI